MPSTDAIQALLPGLRTDARLWLHRLDAINDRALLLRLEEADVRAASFLDDRILQTPRDGAWLTLEHLRRELAAPLDVPAPDYIFHVGHCGSTLLSRMLDALPSTLVLREPQVLRTLTELYRELGEPTALLSQEQWTELCQVVRRALARPFRDGQRIVVKTTSLCSRVAEPLLTAEPESRALLLYTDLPRYLAAMLRGDEARQELRALAPGRLADLLAATGETGIALHELDDAHKGAVNWLAGMAAFARLTNGPLAERARAVRFESLLADPEEVLRPAAALLNLESAPAAIEAAAGDAVMRVSAKRPDRAYDTATRERDLATAFAANRAEIEPAVDWAERLCLRHPALKTTAALARG